MFEYQRVSRYFAQVSTGMEELGVEELQELNAKNVKPDFRGIYFEADLETLYSINYLSRLLSRVLAPLSKFQCHNTKFLYKKAREIEWDKLFSVNHSFAIFANVSNSVITHSQYAALTLKDAIADYFRNKTGARPDVKREEPDVWISLHIENNYATISWDTSGGSLHRRGYRRESVEAPMQETLAAAIMRLSGWDGTTPLYDPFCGSGTLLIEALMLGCQIPAGFLRRRFGFEFLPEFNGRLWQQIKLEYENKISALPAGMIRGSDISRQAFQAARENLKSLPSGEEISLSLKNFEEINSLENNIIITNPPYGIRLGEKKDVADLYKRFGDFLKHKCHGSTAYVYFGDRKLIPQIGLKTAFKKPLRNGGLDGRLCKFEIY